MRSAISHTDALFRKCFDLKLFFAIRMDKIITFYSASKIYSVSIGKTLRNCSDEYSSQV